MKKEYIKMVKSLLFSSQCGELNLTTYAIIDSLRDDKITEKLLFSDLKYVNLWDEDIEAQAQSVPLHLVALTKETDITTYLLENDEKSIATYFLSPYNLEDLQAYYASFTLPKIEDTKDNFKKGVFGFYDPNIVSNYLKTLYNQDKVDEFFAGIAVWFSPSAIKENEFYIAYRGIDAKVKDATLLVSTVNITENPLMLNFANISVPNIPNLEAYKTERTIDYVQVQIFREFAKKAFLEALFKEYIEEGEVFYHSMDTYMELASPMYDEAKEVHNIQSEGGIYRYILLGLIALKPMNELSLYHKLQILTEEWEKVKLLDEQIIHIKNKLKELNDEY
ncbi:MAG TPA: DUF4123 domain-containing protein [Campylobacterales bacterium]|nr:DUF4123 domain-containing protein [Campylobacterales bacterium]